jgi:hypothetical protein
MFDSKKMRRVKSQISPPKKNTVPESLAEELGVELGELGGKKSAYKEVG